MTKTYNNYEDLITFTRASKGHALRPVSYGDELVTNGTFDTDSDWTKDAAWTISNGVASFDDSVNANLQQANIGLEIGKIYQLSFEITAGADANFSLFASGSSEQYIGYTDYAVGNHAVNFICTGGDGVRIAASKFIGSSFSIDNISVKEVTFDESDGTLTLFEHPNNVPRVEYDADGNRLGLLVEESRTNLLARSDAKAWIVSGGGTTTINTDFTLGAFTGAIRASGGQDWHRMYAPYVSVTSGTTYTITAFFKYGTSNNVLLNFRDTAGAQESRITGSAGNLTSSLANAGTVTVLQEEALPNAVRTVVVKYVPDFSGSFEFGIGPNSTTSGETVILLAAQLEQASFGTSYIKTTGSTTTRSADVASIPVADFGFNVDAGSFVMDVNWAGNTTDVSTVIHLGDASDRHLVYYNNGNYRYQVKSANAVTVQAVATGAEENDVIAASYKKDSYFFGDGSAISSDTSGALPAEVLTTLDIGGYSGDNHFNGHIKSIKYYPRQLTSAQLGDLV